MSGSADYSQLQRAANQIISEMTMVNRKSDEEYLAMYLSESLAEMKSQEET